MNTDKIFAEQLANEYAPKDTSKVIALRKLDARAKLLAMMFAYTYRKRTDLYISGLIAIISEWLVHDCETTIEDLITVIQRCVPWGHLALAHNA